MQVRKIDEQGFLIEDIHINQDEQVDFDYVTTPTPKDEKGIQLLFFKPKWDGQKWIEGATQQEIDEHNASQYVEPQLSEIDILKEQLASQQAIIDELLFDILPNLITEEDI